MKKEKALEVHKIITFSGMRNAGRQEEKRMEQWKGGMMEECNGGNKKDQG